jgi:hypothetical protein
MEALSTSKTSVTMYDLIQSHILEDLKLPQHHFENLQVTQFTFISTIHINFHWIILKTHTLAFRPNRLLNTHVSTFRPNNKLLNAHTFAFRPNNRLLNAHTSVFRPHNRLLNVHTFAFRPKNRVMTAHTFAFRPNNRLLNAHTFAFRPNNKLLIAQTFAFRRNNRLLLNTFNIDLQTFHHTEVTNKPARHHQSSNSKLLFHLNEHKLTDQPGVLAVLFPVSWMVH